VNTQNAVIASDITNLDDPCTIGQTNQMLTIFRGEMEKSILSQEQ